MFWDDGTGKWKPLYRVSGLGKNLQSAVLEASDCSCMYMGGCQNYGPFLDPYSNTAPNI